MGRSRIGWALSVAAPWCVAFAVLVSITAEAEQEPPEFTSAFARSQMIGASGGLDRGDPRRARRSRAVDEDGAPLPIVQARYAVGDPDELAADADESEPNGALKQTGTRSFPPSIAAPRAIRFSALQASTPNASTASARPPSPTRIKSWPRELEDPRDDEFDPGHTMSPAAAGRWRRARRPAAPQFRGWRDAGGAARIRAQLLFAHLQRRRRRRRRGRWLGR